MLVWLSECLSGLHGALASPLAWQKPCVMVHTVTPALWVETEVVHCLTRKIWVHHRVPLLPFCFEIFVICYCVRVREYRGADRYHGNCVAI